MIDALFAALGRSVAGHPRLWTAALAVVTGATALLWPRLHIDADVTRMLPRDSATVALAQALEGEAQSGRTLFVLVGGNAIENELPALVDSLRGSPLLDEVAATRAELLGPAFARAQQAPVWFLPEATLHQLEQRLAPAGIAEAIAGLRARIAADPLGGPELALRDPLGLRWILASAVAEAMPVRLRPGTEYVILEGSNRALLRVRGLRPPFDVDFSREVTADLQARLQGHPYELLGGYAVACAEAARVRSDVISSSFSSTVMVLLFLVVSMRSLVRPLFVFVPTVLGLLWALPLGGALLGPLSPIAICGAAMLIGLGVDFAIHYLAHYQDLRAGSTHAQAVELCHRQLSRPLMAAMTTTLAGFAAFAWSRFEGLRSFAWLLVLGLLAAFVATLVALPLLLQLPVGRGRERSAVVAACARITASRAGSAVAIAIHALALGGLLLLLLRGLPFVTDPAELRPAGERAQLLALEEEIGIAPAPQVVLVPASVSLDALARGSERLVRDPTLGVRFVDGPHRDTPGAEVHARVQSFRAATEGFAAVALKELEAQGFAAEPFRKGLAQFEGLLRADPEPAAARPSHAFHGTEWHVVRCFLAHALRDRAGLATFATRARAAFGEGVEVLGPMRLLEEMRATLSTDLGNAMVWSTVATFALTWLLLGNLRRTLLSLWPAACGLSITAGAVIMCGLNLNPVNFVALPMLVGIGVDNGIHLVANHDGPLLGGPTGIAVWRTAVTTLLGFCSLVAPASPGLASLGWITSIGMVACLAASLLMLPLLLRRGRRWSPRHNHPGTARC